MNNLPVIDVGTLVSGRADVGAAAAIDAACRELGFFYAAATASTAALLGAARRARRARSSRCPDDGEGGDRDGARRPRVARLVPASAASSRRACPTGRRASTSAPSSPRRSARARRPPLHGPNLFPARPAGLRAAVLDVARRDDAARPRAARRARRSRSASTAATSRDATPRDPLVLFRIFHYPPAAGGDAELGRRRAHRLRPPHDPAAGRHRRAAGESPRRAGSTRRRSPGAFVCNIGDMLDRMTGGRLPLDAAPRAQPGDARPLSFPFFFDPGWDARDRAAPDAARRDDVGASAGTAPASTRSTAPTATTCSPRSRRCSPSSARGAVGRSRGGAGAEPERSRSGAGRLVRARVRARFPWSRCAGRGRRSKSVVRRRLTTSNHRGNIHP